MGFVEVFGGNVRLLHGLFDAEHVTDEWPGTRAEPGTLGGYGIRSQQGSVVLPGEKISMLEC